MGDESGCIYLLHGFASAPKYPSDKVDALESVFDLPVKQLAYESAAGFADNMARLKKQVIQKPRLFVGTSLGAFYASKLSELFYTECGAGSLFLNPCHDPYAVLENAVAEHANFATGETFTFTQQARESYQSIPFIERNIRLPRIALLNMDDELIDSFETKELFGEKFQVITFAEGGHRFENISSDEVLASLHAIKRHPCIGYSGDARHIIDEFPKWGVMHENEMKEKYHFLYELCPSYYVLRHKYRNMIAVAREFGGEYALCLRYEHSYPHAHYSQILKHTIPFKKGVVEKVVTANENICSASFDVFLSMAEHFPVISDNKLFGDGKELWKYLAKHANQRGIVVKVWDATNGEWLMDDTGCTIYNGENIPESGIWPQDPTKMVTALVAMKDAKAPLE